MYYSYGTGSMALSVQTVESGTVGSLVLFPDLIPAPGGPRGGGATAVRMAGLYYTALQCRAVHCTAQHCNPIPGAGVPLRTLAHLTRRQVAPRPSGRR